MTLGENVGLDEISDKFKNLGQILEKPCEHSRGHIFSLMFMKLGQIVCLYEISDESKMGYVGSKTRSLGEILEKTLCTL